MKRVVRISIVLLIALGIVLGVVKLRRNSHANNKASIANQNNLIVHEWGTFTSIAGKDGVTLEWRPLNGSADLPGFVHTIKNYDDGLRHAPKADLRAVVRNSRHLLLCEPGYRCFGESGFSQGQDN